MDFSLFMYIAEVMLEELRFSIVIAVFETFKIFQLQIKRLFETNIKNLKSLANIEVILASMLLESVDSHHIWNACTLFFVFHLQAIHELINMQRSYSFIFKRTSVNLKSMELDQLHA